jgi:hypothetical protein
MKAKILIYGDSNWSVGSVHKNIAKYLKNDFDFEFYDWKDYTPISILELIDNFDIIFTNLVTLSIYKEANIPLKKFIFIAHGYPDIIGYKNDKKYIDENFSPDAFYTVTSNSIKSLFPSNLTIFNTFNGVDLDEFSYKTEIEKGINKIGWCGAPNVKSKRYEWGIEIAKKTLSLLTIASTIPKYELNKWYQKIDLLIITAGPEEWVETGPLPAFEAIISGTLVIGTKVGNFQNIPGPKFDTIEEAIKIINDLKNNPTKIQEIK